MDSSPVLRQQSQNKIRSDFMRMKNEQNKKVADPKPSKPMSASHLSNKDIENKDPVSSAIGKKAPLRAGISRLPVLAKSLHLQTPSDFSQSHCRWEEKPLARKAPKKKPLTRPVPFNLSQPKSTRTAAENQPLADPKLRTHANTKLSKHPTALTGNKDSTKAPGKPLGKTTEDASHLSGPTGPSSTFQTSSLSTAMSSLPDSAATSAQPAPSAEVCLNSMNLLSLKDHSKTAHDSRTTQCNSSKEKGENFQPDHAALLSILRNEGVGVTGPAPTTPQSKPYNYLPQRVSVMKSRQKAGPPAGSVKSVQFSPDPAALQSILQNEGVKAGGPVGTTPRSSVCPPSRATSIYTAQRVPVRKNRPEATAVPATASAALKETPLNKWTPQRVRNTRHQPLSAMKWHQSPYGTPGFKSCKTNLQPRQEEVVQRLFDEEGEQSANVTEKDCEQRPVQASASKSHCDKEEEKSRTNDDDDDEEEEEKLVGEQMFLQAQHRESVIFFSTGKKLFRVPRLEKLGDSALQDQCAPVSPEERKGLPVHSEVPAVPEPSCKINPSVQRPHRDLVGQKTCSVSSAVMMLRKRFPPLEELRLDEEVATYTSASVQAPPGFAPLRPSCGNPLASILHFEESTRFVPIGSDLSSGPPSPLQDS
ncbi:unnamed protein product [Oreochromis niloticus]|nr:unnamed protein product [Mustela putorius furo]